MDPLSEVLSLVKINHYWSGGFDWGGEWCLAFRRHPAVRVFAILSGECWLAIDGMQDPIRSRPGDCLVLPSGRPFRVGNNLTRPPLDALSLDAGMPNGRFGVYNGGGSFSGLGCNFNLAGEHTDLLVGMLPPVVHIHRESDKAALRWCVERMQEELRSPQLGGFLVAQQLATQLLIQALRLHLAEVSTAGVGWLYALADPQMRAAITAMHNDLARHWTVQLLAKHVGMSRTAFAVKFKATVGQPPLDYLTRWRMLRAADRLTHSDDSILTIAQSLGYESESAFSTAFKREMGCAPRQFVCGNSVAPGKRK